MINKKNGKRESQEQMQEENELIKNEEQKLRRQSAPRPSDESAMTFNRTIDGFKVISQPIGEKQLQNARLTLNKYREGKINFEKKIVSNEQWYKMRHWEQMRGEKRGGTCFWMAF